MLLTPFKYKGKKPDAKRGDPVPELYGLTDDDVDVLRQWFPDYAPGDSIVEELEPILMHDLGRPATEVAELTVPQIIGLLGRASEHRGTSTSRVTERGPMIIFYSWQSDLPNHLNRGFIRDAMDQAAKELSTATNIEARIDQDTQGLAGSPDVFNSILEKIGNSDAFLCDVSVIGRVCDDNDESGRSMVNPNVLVELGYALAVLGQERVIMVVNEAFGNPRDLPFDLGFKRQVVYRAEGEKGVVRAVEKKSLAGRLKQKFGEISEVVQRDHMVRCIWDRLKGYRRSFDHLRKGLGPAYTDEFFAAILKSHSEYFAPVTIKGGKPGLRRADNAPATGPGRFIKLT
jgi:hypothetical protein